MSAFHGKGKKSARDAWLAYDQLTDAFAMMMNPTTAANFEMFMPVIERFVVVMYDRTSSAMHVDEARLHLFAQRENP